MECECINLGQVGIGAGIAAFVLLAGAALVWKVADLVRWCKKFTLAVVERTPRAPASAESSGGFSLGAKVVTVAALVLGGGAVAYLLTQFA